MDGHHLPILLTIGFAVFLGSSGAWIFQLLRIPQVVGYIVIGIVIGKSGFGIINGPLITSLQPLNFFALGVIGFMIGGELHRNVFRKYGSQFVKILVSEGMMAFAVVALLTGTLTWFTLHDLRQAISLGLLLGAIASATAPAATVDVLWEYKTRGILTTTVLAIVALDDALGLFLYSFAASIASVLLDIGGTSALSSFLHAAWQLGGAMLLGGLAGFILNLLIRRLHAPDKTLTMVLGILTLVLGIALYADLDVILAAMVLGMVLINLAPHRSREAFKIVEQFSPPIYALFFVFVGARLTVTGMPFWMWALAAAYVIGRTAGKMSGAYLGARWAKAPESVRKYLGLCLFSQAGVAIGLSILAGIRFHETMLAGVPMGNVIVMVVTATTFLVQIIGPPSVKIAVKKGQEVGLNVGEDDLIRSYKVGDVMHENTPSFFAQTTVGEILRGISDTEAMAYPILNAKEQVVGIVTVEDLKQVFSTPEVGTWIVALDVMRPAPDIVLESTPLQEAFDKARETGLDVLPVVHAQGDEKYVGLFEVQAVKRRISQEVLRRRQAADATA
jgi:Kef-type K+ transport system membrane component KefB